MSIAIRTLGKHLADARRDEAGIVHGGDRGIHHGIDAILGAPGSFDMGLDRVAFEPLPLDGDIVADRVLDFESSLKAPIH